MKTTTLTLLSICVLLTFVIIFVPLVEKVNLHRGYVLWKGAYITFPNGTRIWQQFHGRTPTEFWKYRKMAEYEMVGVPTQDSYYRERMSLSYFLFGFGYYKLEW